MELQGARRGWSAAFDELLALEREGALDAEGLERLAVAAYMVGRDEECEDARTRAHQEWLRRGEETRAARCAFLQALGFLFKGEMAPGMGWVARGRRVLEHGGGDCAEQGWLLALTGSLTMLGDGDPMSAQPMFVKAGEIGVRFGDVDLVALSSLGLGHSLVMTRRVADGVALLDEVMVAVTAEEVSPIMVGVAYCEVIAVCHSVFDLRRAREWTTALGRWCDEQPDLVPFRGNCLVHRCEILQLQGEWPDAVDAARRACEWLAGPPAWDSLGSAYYQLAEIQRLQGQLDAAEASYRSANEAGRPPEPGLSLLRLSQGRGDAAVASMQRVLDEAQDPMTRAKVLPAFVEIMLATGDLASGRRAADELGQIAEQVGAPLLVAVAAHASGAVLLESGEPTAALVELRAAWDTWRDLDAPHETACTRVLIGLACRALGDEGTAEMEWDAARRTFEKLGAEPDLARLRDMSGPERRPAGLTAREVEILRLVASGKTNRAIASDLVLSDKTVARHLANIFTKLGVSSRSAATAYAYESGLMTRST